MLLKPGQPKTVLVTGGAGYVGSALVPRLLKEGHKVKVLDLYLYGDDVLNAVKGNPNLTEIKGDIRDQALLKKSLAGVDAVIHLACISNDPSFELNPSLGASINHDAFLPLVRISRDSGVKRFVYASSSSVYGVKAVQNVTEDLPLEPLTDYSKFKALCEEELVKEIQPGFEGILLRPATVCGYAPRLRLDLTVNILTNHAVNNRAIKVFGGDQMRPNIHIDDVVELYVQSLLWDGAKVSGRVFNAGYENHTVKQIADMVKAEVGPDVVIKVEPTDDHRSYHISSERIRKELGFFPKRTIQDAVKDLVDAFHDKKIPDSMTATRYFNIKRMQEVHLQ